jgi:AcrR family transcriptional regulator
MVSARAGNPILGHHAGHEVRREDASMARSRTQVQRGVDTREAIIEAAIRQFGAKGYAGARLDVIAAEAGVSRPGLLYHFNSKEELFEAILDKQRDNDRSIFGITEIADLAGSVVVESFFETVSAVPDFPDLARLFHVLVGESVLDDAPTYRYIRDRYQALRKGIARALRRGMATGEVRSDSDAEMIAAVMIAASDGLRTQMLLEPDFDYHAGAERLRHIILSLVVSDEATPSE